MTHNWRNTLLLVPGILLLIAYGDQTGSVPQDSASGDSSADTTSDDSSEATTSDDSSEATAANTTQDFSGGVGGSGNGPVSIYGSITGFGSVWVNGFEFETPSSISMNGEDASELDLNIGMVVRLSGSIHDDSVSGTADEISFDSLVHGPIADTPLEDPDSLTKEFTVLGVTVRIEPGVTEFWDDSATFGYASVAQGDVVSISGFFDQNGILRASYVNKTGEYSEGETEVPLEVRVSGTISSLDSAAFLLRTLAVTFDLSGTETDLSAIAGGTLTDGMEVVVSGVLGSASSVVATALARLKTSKHIELCWRQNIVDRSIQFALYFPNQFHRISGVATTCPTHHFPALVPGRLIGQLQRLGLVAADLEFKAEQCPIALQRSQRHAAATATASLLGLHISSPAHDQQYQQQRPFFHGILLVSMRKTTQRIYDISVRRKEIKATIKNSTANTTNNSTSVERTSKRMPRSSGL